MAITTINVGTNPNDGTGDSLRTSFTICNNNFSYLESIISGNGIVSANSLVVTGNVLLGESLSFTPPGAALQYGGTANSYVQMVMQNKSSLTNASTDFVATADNGDDANRFVDLGIASSTYYYAGFESILPNDAYLLVNGGNLLLNPGSADKSVKFVIGGSGTGDVVGQFSNTALTITPTTASIGVGSGALQVAGGTSIAGDTYTGGNVSSAGFVLTGNGLVTTDSFDGPFASGIAVDYLTGNGRISLGSVTDGLHVYNNGLAGTRLFNLSGTGNLSILGSITSTDAIVNGNIGLLGNSSIVSASGFNLINVNTITYRVYNQLGTNTTAITANLFPGTSGIAMFEINANVTISYSGTISTGAEKKYFIKNVGGSSANIIMPNSNNNKASNVVLVTPGTVASVIIAAIDTTEANVVATIINN